MDQKPITTETILSKVKEYQFELIFMLFIVIFASLAKTIFNFILDYRIVIITICILWYLGYMNRIRKAMEKNLKKINYFKADK
jgi:ACR3 family arsenite efflux pump ArsB